MLAVAEVLVIDADGRVLCHQPASLFDDRPLERRLLPGVAYDLLEIVVVEDPAHDVLGAGLQSALEERHLKAGLGHRDGGRSAGRAGADDDRVEPLLVSHLSQS